MNIYTLIPEAEEIINPCTHNKIHVVKSKVSFLGWLLVWIALVSFYFIPFIWIGFLFRSKTYACKNCHRILFTKPTFKIQNSFNSFCSSSHNIVGTS